MPTKRPPSFFVCPALATSVWVSKPSRHCEYMWCSVFLKPFREKRKRACDKQRLQLSRCETSFLCAPFYGFFFPKQAYLLSASFIKYTWSFSSFDISWGELLFPHGCTRLQVLSLLPTSSRLGKHAPQPLGSLFCWILDGILDCHTPEIQGFVRLLDVSFAVQAHFANDKVSLFVYLHSTAFDIQDSSFPKPLNFLKGKDFE